MIAGKSFDTEGFKEEPLDNEIKKLVYLINQVDGVETTESCFGHHKIPCRIWLRIKDVETANKFIKKFFYFDPLWNLSLTFSEVDHYNELLFVLESKYDDYQAVDLMVENLTNRFKERLKEVKPFEGVTTTDAIKQSEWIPVSERLPKELFVKTLVSCEDHLGLPISTTVSFYDAFSKTWDCKYKVIAWMPLPEPYDEGERV